MRITSRGGRPTVDGPSDGRGAWLCRQSSDGSIVDAACLDSATRRGGFARVWRRAVPPDEIEAIRRALRTAAGGTNGAHSDAH